LTILSIGVSSENEPYRIQRVIFVINKALFIRNPAV